MTSPLIQLAERVEAATGPDRELDAEIYAALDSERDNLDALAINGEIGSWVPEFTASLDAAKTLWPGEVPHLIPSDPRICTAMALRAIASQEQGE